MPASAVLARGCSATTGRSAPAYARGAQPITRRKAVPSALVVSYTIAALGYPDRSYDSVIEA